MKKLELKTCCEKCKKNHSTPLLFRRKFLVCPCHTPTLTEKYNLDGEVKKHKNNCTEDGGCTCFPSLDECKHCGNPPVCQPFNSKNICGCPCHSPSPDECKCMACEHRAFPDPKKECCVKCVSVDCKYTYCTCHTSQPECKTCLGHGSREGCIGCGKYWSKEMEELNSPWVKEWELRFKNWQEDPKFWEKDMKDWITNLLFKTRQEAIGECMAELEKNQPGAWFPGGALELKKKYCDEILSALNKLTNK